MHFLEERDANCPYCGERISLLLDLSAGDQHYIEDCPVCCRPMEVRLAESENGRIELELYGENDADH